MELAADDALLATELAVSASDWAMAVETALLARLAKLEASEARLAAVDASE